MPRANFTNFRNAMEQHNALIADFCLNNDVPEEHFIKQDLTVHPVVISAARKAVILQREMFKFLDELVTCFRFSDSDYSHGWRYAATSKLTLRYPVIWNADKTGVITFPNLLLDNCNRRTVTDMVNENPWIPVHTASVTETIKADLAHPERRAAWTPMSRGIKRLGKRQELSMSRALARAVLWDGKPIENAQVIENIAQKMLDIYKPADFYFADTVDEMRAMYRRESDETPHSCMDSRHRFNLEGDVRPVDFYAYCPNSRGAYIAKGNIVLARTILWRGQDDKWCYSRIYAGRAAHRETLITHLEEAGVADIETAHCRVNCSFSIPLGYFNGDKAMPVPYIDSRPFSTVQVKVDDTHFTVSMGGKRKDSKDGWQFQAYKAPAVLSSHPSITGVRTAALKSTWMTIALSVSIQTSTVAMTVRLTTMQFVSVPATVTSMSTTEMCRMMLCSMASILTTCSATDKRLSIAAACSVSFRGLRPRSRCSLNQPSMMSVMWSGQWSSSMPRHPHG